MNNLINKSLSIFSFIGIIGLILFHSDIFFTINISIIVFLYSFYITWKEYFSSRIGLLSVAFILIYSLPFIHIIPYLWYDFENSNPSSMWGLLANPYMKDKSIISLTSMIGCIGICGIMIGILFRKRRLLVDKRYSQLPSNRFIKTLPINIYLVWIFISFILAGLTAPSSNVFSGGFGSEVSFLAETNIYSAWLVPNLMNAIIFSDGFFESNKDMRKLKLTLSISLISFSTLYYNLLRGDRESISLLIGIGFLILITKGYGVWNKEDQIQIQWKKIILITLFIQVISIIIAATRNELFEVDKFIDFYDILTNRFIYSDEVSILGFFFHGTWSATLLTPLSLAGDYINGLLNFNFGEDYWNTLLSIPPGFIADIIGYTRPVNIESNIALNLRYGLGGYHLLVMPFLNFGLIGVFLIHIIIGRYYYFFEQSFYKRLSIVNASAVISIIFILPHWIWYTEKILINSAIIFCLLILFYRLSLALKYNKIYKI